MENFIAKGDSKRVYKISEKIIKNMPFQRSKKNIAKILQNYS